MINVHTGMFVLYSKGFSAADRSDSDKCDTDVEKCCISRLDHA